MILFHHTSKGVFLYKKYMYFSSDIFLVYSNVMKYGTCIKYTRSFGQQLLLSRSLVFPMHGISIEQEIDQMILEDLLKGGTTANDTV